MAETGVRFDHLPRTRVDDLLLDKSRHLLGEMARPKRHPLIFLTEGAAKYLAEVHLPWRERFKRMLGQRSDRLFSCEELKLLRKFSTLWLLDRSVDPTEVDLLQSRSVT